MSASSRVVVVGASLAGLRAAEALREGGHHGPLIIIGAEAHRPYDRPPLSKQVLSGWVKPHETTLPRARDIGASWRLGLAASAVDLAAREVEIAGGARTPFDRLVIATGTRARAWPLAAQAALAGVHMLRTREDAEALVDALERRPARVLVIGAGFTGCEVASACRDRGLAVTVLEVNRVPLMGALGTLVGEHAARLQRAAGVDLRCGVRVEALLDDGAGRAVGARLQGGERIEASVIVVCLGAVRNVDWLCGSGLAAGPAGVLCDDGCRVLDGEGRPADGVFACGDVACVPHPLAQGQAVSLEHWGTALDQARIVAANLLHPGSASNADSLPRFWSMQFGTNFKAAGLPAQAQQVMVLQGSAADGRFVAGYGRDGRLVGVVAVNQAQWMTYYEHQVSEGAPFPPKHRVVDPPSGAAPQAAGFPTSVASAGRARARDAAVLS